VSGTGTGGFGGRTALVTGAAGGIGAEVARELAARGARVAAVDRDAERLREVVGKLRGEGLESFAVPADVTSADAVEEAVQRVEQQIGPLEYLVNAAGVLRTGRATELSESDWQRSLAVNATGAFHVSRAAASRMAPRGSGAIVTVTSNAAGTARVGMAAYAASKAAAEAFSRCLGLELAGSGIRCNTVAPGSTDTPMLTALWEGDDEGARRVSVEGSPQHYRVGIPLGRVADPRHVTGAVLFLLSDDASHITMHTLTVDGGATLGA
jgi:2,3-dihydro-2,3-dihydroxybenzoate dehydrogenase